MVISDVEKPYLEEESLSFDQENFQYFVEEQVLLSTSIFRRKTRRIVLFHLAFFLLFSLETVCFSFLFAFIARSHLLSFTFSIAFLSLFSYFILRLYWKSHQPEQLLVIRTDFHEACRSYISYQEGIPDHHLALAQAACRFANRLENFEYTIYDLPKWLEPLNAALQKFSCFWHWEDVIKLRELLLRSSIEEYLKLIKSEPTNLELHASLANAYVLLSGIYAEPNVSDDDERWVPPERFSEEAKAMFRSTAQRATEEFQILNEYAPNDPWIHAQLAYSYHDLNMPEEEIKEYEIILDLRPDDKETLFKLGVLYFQQGRSAQGLRVYEELRRSHYKQATALIKFYGNH